MIVRLPAGVRHAFEGSNLFGRPEMLEGVQVAVHQALRRARPAAGELELDVGLEEARYLAGWLQSCAFSRTLGSDDPAVRASIDLLCGAVGETRRRARTNHPAGSGRGVLVA